MGSAMFPGEGEGPSQTVKVVYWIITVICAIIWICLNLQNLFLHYGIAKKTND